MAEQLTKEQIIETYHQKMIAALEGRSEILDVCALGIETLFSTIIAKKKSLLERYGWTTSGTHEGRQTSNSSGNEHNQ